MLEHSGHQSLEKPSQPCCLHAGHVATLLLLLESKNPWCSISTAHGTLQLLASWAGRHSVLRDDPWVLQPPHPKSLHFLSMKFFLALLRGAAKCQDHKITGLCSLVTAMVSGGGGWMPMPGSSFPCKEQGLCHAQRDQRATAGGWPLCKLRPV